MCEGSVQKTEYSTEIITDSVCLTCRAENVSALVPLCMSASADVNVNPFLGLCVKEKKRKDQKVSQQEKPFIVCLSECQRSTTSCCWLCVFVCQCELVARPVIFI